MNKLILATAAVLVLGTPLALANGAHAGAVTPAIQTKTHMTASALPGRCAALNAKFDAADAMHKADQYRKDALALRLEGETLCSSHEQAAGARYLASALRVIDAEPKI